jgi:hypothetical protein
MITFSIAGLFLNGRCAAASISISISTVRIDSSTRCSDQAAFRDIAKIGLFPGWVLTYDFKIRSSFNRLLMFFSCSGGHGGIRLNNS